LDHRDEKLGPIARLAAIDDLLELAIITAPTEERLES
jgi:hypothetical protein